MCLQKTAALTSCEFICTTPAPLPKLFTAIIRWRCSAGNTGTCEAVLLFVCLFVWLFADNRDALCLMCMDGKEGLRDGVHLDNFAGVIETVHTFHHLSNYSNKRNKQPGVSTVH